MGLWRVELGQRRMTHGKSRGGNSGGLTWNGSAEFVRDGRGLVVTDQLELDDPLILELLE
jgi:hypothetical protein